MKNYISHSERQNWLQLIYLGEALDKIIASDVNYSKAMTNLKKGKTFLLKGINEFTGMYPQQTKTILNDVNYFDMLFMPKNESRKHYDKYIEREVINAIGDPLEQLYEVLDVTLEATCKNCSGKADCRLKEVYKKYNIPCIDESDAVCVWRY